MEQNDNSNNYDDYFIQVEPEQTFTIAEFTPQPMHISFHDVKTSEFLGAFKEVDGVLTFEGNVDESGKIFTDYICSAFNSRIEHLIKEAKEGSDDSI